ncbi:MAG: efflux RND transporter periplasmic adaptor subunit [Desulfobacteraceae bacterium]|nr:MAG: efflux RND transporter periplasmic adaptor subunit [Desulfobacteraceae bacterium]
MEDRSDIAQTLHLGENNQRTRRIRRWFAWGVLVVILVATIAFWARGNTKASIEYKTQEVVRGALTVTVTATGNLAPTNKVEVGSELSGIIKTVLVDFNDRVKIGQPLAYLDDTKFEAAVMQSRAALASALAKREQAQATLRQKEQNLQRLKRAHVLSGGRAPSAGELELAEADLMRAQADEGVAQAAIQQARAALKIDETNLSKTTIYSPVNGIVLTRSVDPGQTVAASLQAPVLFVLAEDLRQMELQVDVDEADVGKVRAGQSATFTVDAYPDRIFNALIKQVRFGSQMTNGVVTYTTLLNVENPDLLLRPGMTATAEVVVEKIAGAVLVPNAALRFMPVQNENRSKGGGGRGLMGMLYPRPPRVESRANSGKGGRNAQRVWTLTGDRPTPVVITTGPTDGTMSVIQGENLQPGSRVIVDAVHKK